MKRWLLTVGIAMCIGTAAYFGLDWFLFREPECGDVANSEMRAHSDTLGTATGPSAIILIFPSEHLLFSRNEDDPKLAAKLGGRRERDCTSDEGRMRWQVWRVPGFPPGFNPGASAPEPIPTSGH